MRYIIRKNCFDKEGNLVNSSTVYMTNCINDAKDYVSLKDNSHLYKIDCIYDKK